MGMVFQSYALWPHMTRVRERRLRPARPARRRARRSRTRVARVLELVGLAGLERALSERAVAAASSSAWRWRARWCSSPRSCCSTSRCRTSTPSCASAMRWELKDAAAPHRHHVRLRHPRSGRGAGALRSHRRDARRASCSSSARRARSTAARPTASVADFMGLVNLFPARVRRAGPTRARRARRRAPRRGHAASGA